MLAIISAKYAHRLLTLNYDIPGLDVDLDPLGDLEQFLGVAVVPMSAHVHLVLQMLRAAGGYRCASVACISRERSAGIGDFTVAIVETYMYFILRVAAG